MKNLYYFKYILLLSLALTLFSCGSDDGDQYVEVTPETPAVPLPPGVPQSPVVVDFNAAVFPYTSLSEYRFFEGDMKNLNPAYKVIPYDLNSSLFTDYALKKRFIWMPTGAKATYSADGKVLNFPSGTVLIKNFFYTTVQPDNTTKIIETRLMIKKYDQWVFATYVWNDEQTEAVLNMDGSYKYITFKQNETVQNLNYRVPAAFECTHCHKLNAAPTAIGVKPQNLNKIYNYPEGPKNQLEKLVQEGYLDGSNLPSSIVSTVNWSDTSKPLELRVRSYLDINCAHCHSQGGVCDYTPMRLGFSESTTSASLGVCVVPVDFVSGGQTYIVAKKNVAKSLMYFRMNTTAPSEMMPQLGRSMTHTEGVQLIADWINSMDEPCQ
jgi:uncharacterized repeat protein (TIGR03806 family)